MSYILGALLFSFMLYLLVFLLFFSSKNDPIIFKAKSKSEQKENGISKSEAGELLNKLKEIMEIDGIYKNPNLKLADIAKKLHVQPATISQILNQYEGYGFPHFL